ncbi:MAG: FtsB family cell division protein [Solirubrobacterales bacterium]
MSARAQAARGYRMRPAPRRGRRGRRASRIQWDRVGRIALVLVLFAVLFSYIGPTMNFVGAWHGSKAEQTHLAALRQENAKLRKRAEDLKGPDAAEREARKLGMVDPSAGEASFVVKGLR